MASKVKPRIAIDSCVLVHWLTGQEPKYREGIESLFHEVQSRQVDLLASYLLATEALGSKRKEPVDTVKENTVLSFLNDRQLINLSQVTRQIAFGARDLSRELNLRAADAIHLASAIAVRADVFMTTDEDDYEIGSVVRGVKIELPQSAFGASVLTTAG